MRIFGGRIELAVLVGLPLAIADTQRVNFNRGFDEGVSVAGNKSAIFSVFASQPTARSFFWSIAAGDFLKVDTINLFVINKTRHDQIGSSDSGSGGNAGATGTSASPSPTAPQGFPTIRPGSGGPGRRKRAETGLQGALKVNSSPRAGSVIIDNFQSLLTFKGLVMYFEAVWPENDGRSYSRAFTVVDGTVPDEALGLAEAGRFLDPNPVIGQSGGNGVGIATGGTTTPTAVTPESSISDSGGLGTGAIAGIAVGGFFALVIAAALVWFFCIRLRGQANDEAALGAYGNARARTDELIAEKEANAGVDVAPHSPYSDEGGGVIGGSRHESSSLHNVNPAAIPPVTSHHRELSQQPLKSYTPYSDHPSAGGVGSPSTRAASMVAGDHPISRGGSPATGRTTPHGMAPTQYAHLVEEGMTDDEIRRLEEEERALDAAIEQAGRKP